MVVGRGKLRLVFATSGLHLEQDRMFHIGVGRGEISDRESGKAIQDAELQEICADERKPRCEDGFDP